MSRRLLFVVIFVMLSLMACAPESASGPTASRDENPDSGEVPKDCRIAETDDSWESLAEEFGLDTDNERRGLLAVNILADSDGEVYPGAVVCLDKEQREYVSGDSQIADPTTKVRSDGTTVKMVEKPELVTDKKIVGSQLEEDDPFASVQLVPKTDQAPPSEEQCQPLPDAEGSMDGDPDSSVSGDDCPSSENENPPGSGDDDIEDDENPPGSGDDEIEDDESPPGSGDDIEETTDTTSEAQ